jgi:hypothetical protein
VQNALPVALIRSLFLPQPQVLFHRKFLTMNDIHIDPILFGSAPMKFSPE